MVDPSLFHLQTGWAMPFIPMRKASGVAFLFVRDGTYFSNSFQLAYLPIMGTSLIFFCPIAAGLIGEATLNQRKRGVAPNLSVRIALLPLTKP